MLPLFEEETKPLTDLEIKELLPHCVAILKGARGKDNIIQNWRIGAYIERESGHTANGYRVRKLITHIRMKGLIEGLIATNKGYYISSDPAELELYIKSLDHRGKMILSLINRFRNYHKSITQPPLFN